MGKLRRAAGLPITKFTACAALEELVEGNRRFVLGEQQGCRNDVQRREGLREGQAPKAVVLTCADSRCPPELIFDQGFGDLFVIRVAGNCVSEHVMGSISYALQNLGTRLVIVMGHTRCGAVKAAVAEFVDQARQRQLQQDSASSEGGTEDSPGTSDLQAEGSGSLDRPLSDALAAIIGGGSSSSGSKNPANGASAGGTGTAAGPARAIRGFVQRLLGALGGREATETLVRTASFRDLEHLDNPVNSIVSAILPAVKQIVWEVLQGSGNSSPAGLSPARSMPEPAADADSSGGTDAVHTSVEEAARAVVAAAAAQAAAVAASAAEWGGGGAAGPPRGGLSQNESMSGLVEKMSAPLLNRPSIDGEVLHRRLAQQGESGHLCLDSHLLNSNNLLNEVAYQNVRRQCSQVWDAMQRNIEGPAAAELLMVQAVYSLDDGTVDLFGLHG